MEKLIEQIREHCTLGPEEERLLRQTVRELHFPKGAVVIGTGKIDDSMYFIRQGVWRAYVEREGEQLTLWFAVPGEVLFSSWGYVRGMPSRHTITSSSDSMVLELKKSVLEKLIETSPGILKWVNNILMDVILGNDDVIIDLSSPKAEKRYLAFMKKMPEIFRNVPLKEVAGFIGVTPQSLSRIRAGLGRKKE